MKSSVRNWRTDFLSLSRSSFSSEAVDFVFPLLASLSASSIEMGRGVSSGGGQSSLDYLFGGGEAPKPAAKNVSATPAQAPVKEATSAKPTGSAPPVDITKQVPAGINSSNANNYFRADGQNCGNFITDRPSTKVHAAPGGGSSLDYLFGGGMNKIIKLNSVKERSVLDKDKRLLIII
ncbi:LOW QUALITY PROTEIN: hypothetical protein V2J09_020024 [Rumex salicifolius]